MMMMLPSPPRRGSVRSFWLVISVLAGSLSGALAAVFLSAQWFVMGLVLVPMIALPGLVWPRAVSGVYEAWNGVAGFYCRAARVLVKGICFYLVLAPANWTSSSLRLRRPPSGQSLWTPRRTLPAMTYGSQYDGGGGDSLRTGWILRLLSWTVRSGNIWALSLLPFMVMLSALETDEEISFPSNIYTLF